MPDLDPFGTRAPYWRRHYGIGASMVFEAWRTPGLLLLLYGALAMIVLALLVAAIAALLR